MNAQKIVNKLLETDPDSPEGNLERISQDIYQKSDLPAPLRRSVKQVRGALVWTAKALLALGRDSGLDERDHAVSKLGGCAEALDRLQYDFPAHDWVKLALMEALVRLTALLNADSFAKPQDAAVILEIIKLLDKVLQ